MTNISFLIQYTQEGNLSKVIENIEKSNYSAARIRKSLLTATRHGHKNIVQYLLETAIEQEVEVNKLACINIAIAHKNWELASFVHSKVDVDISHLSLEEVFRIFSYQI